MVSIVLGLPEGNVDSDEDDESCPSGGSYMELHDNVRECLEKDPSERCCEDIHVLLDFMQNMPAFANLPMCVRRELCCKMVFAIVDKAGTVVMKNGEQLDSWSVIVNGEVEVTLPNGQKKSYHLGDSFGVKPVADPQYHVGEMRTVVDDCQFVLMAQADYVRIMLKVPENFQRHTDSAGEIISETERRYAIVGLCFLLRFAGVGV
ncbi:unnamed protein product [Soboliphyme baturini]|uniref:Cyclic nucleotide-binding domain-containing protein n=1 Tax=Soboliphyme baturini TaxID=241478 RepID=A0A183J2N0_9BILA|nr:unnamed protein product [Soboliphyme baturini]